jgi:ribosomal protein S27AE
MTTKPSVEAFCHDCGTRVVLALGRDPCRVTAGGTVYRECPSCGQTIAAHPRRAA